MEISLQLEPWALELLVWELEGTPPSIHDTDYKRPHRHPQSQKSIFPLDPGRHA